jgi:hypothetical protein
MSMYDLYDELRAKVWALRCAWADRTGRLLYDATPEQVATMADLPAGKALIYWLLAQSPPMLFTLAALMQIGYRRSSGQ